MNRYALVVDDTHMTEGVHALLNALIYYGADEIDFHYLWWPGSTAQQALDAGTFSFYPNFYPHRFDADLFPPEYAPLFADTANACYAMRWAFAGALRDYQAVSIFDADILLVNDPRPWFRVAAQTGMFCVAGNDYSGNELDAFDLSSIEGDASPPIHNQPSFWRNDAWGDFMLDLPLKSLRERRSDITTLSRKLIEEDRLGEVLVLGNWQFLQTHYYNLRLCKREVGGKRYLALHANGDRLVSVHRRWWIPYECTRFVTDITEPSDRARGLNNIRLFHEMYNYFNLDCEHRLDGYDPTWEEPA